MRDHRMGPGEHGTAMGQESTKGGEGDQAITYTKKKGLWSGIKSIFHQRQRTPSRSRGDRRQDHSLTSLSYSCLGQARQQEEEDIYGGFGERSGNCRGRERIPRERLSRNLSMSHESVFQMEPLPNQVEVDDRLSAPRNTSSVVLPPMIHTELQAVLRMRESRSRNLSKQSYDYTDDEDLGLPKSLQNSPGDFSDEMEAGPGLRAGTGWGGSRHHSSCSDNSLLSLDSYSEHQTPERRDSPLHKGLNPGDGRLSHLAARHKMAVRPRRNHAVKPTRKLHQLTEVVENESSTGNVGTSDIIVDMVAKEGKHMIDIDRTEGESRFEEQKAKSKSLDMSFRGASPPSSSTLLMLGQETDKYKNRSKTEQEGNFLSRLFGSKRQKMRSSTNKKDQEDRVSKPQGQMIGPPVETRLSYYQSTPTPPSKSPPRHKTKPPAPPPPESTPPPTGLGLKKSQSFRQQGMDSNPGDVPEFPSLPAQVQVVRPEVILKKNKSMSSALSVEDSHQRFRSSIENWSFANEGLKKSIGSLTEGRSIPTAQSSESLKTISSLLEEPDMLEQTSILGDITEDLSLTRVEDCNGILIDRSLLIEESLFKERNMLEESETDVEKLGCEKGGREREMERQKDEVEEGGNMKDDGLEIYHRQESGDAGEPSPRDSFIEECNNSVTNDEEMCNEETNEINYNTDGLKTELEYNNHDSENDYKPKYNIEEETKLLELADPQIDRRCEEEITFSEEVIDDHLEIIESDLDLSINSLDVFHSALSLQQVQEKSSKSEEEEKTKLMETQESRKHLLHSSTSPSPMKPMRDVFLVMGPVTVKESVVLVSPGSSHKASGDITHSDNTSDETTMSPSQNVDVQIQDIVSPGLTISTNQDSEVRKPEISPKPVPAPRHFFLRKTSHSGFLGNSQVSEFHNSELSSAWARKSQSASTGLLEREKEFPAKETNGTDTECEKENEPSKEIIINVKERAKSFSGIQNLAFVTPQPFRPSSIAHEIRMTKPVNIPPKPKLPVKPIPAPRQFRSVSSSELGGRECRGTLPLTKSASSFKSRVQTSDSVSTPEVSNVSGLFTSHQTSVTSKTSMTPVTSITSTTSVTSAMETSFFQTDSTNLEDIQVKRILSQFQKSKSPEKPIRKHPPSSKEKVDMDSEDPSRNVMSIARKFNAMATTGPIQ